MRIFRRGATILLGLAVLAAGSSGASAAPAESAATAREKLQAEINVVLAQAPGSRQTAPNQVESADGNVVLSLPVPASISGEVMAAQRRADVKRQLDFNAQLGVAVDTPTVAASATAYKYGCPYETATSADWYCLYANENFNGIPQSGTVGPGNARMLQFREN